MFHSHKFARKKYEEVFYMFKDHKSKIGNAALQCLDDIRINDVKLEKRWTTSKNGYGVFALQIINAFEPIGVYPGKPSIFDNEDQLTNVDAYCFAFQYNDKFISYDGTSSSEWSSDITKYLNHCVCGRRQNVKHRILQKDKDQLPLIVLFTERNIRIGEELRHNYGGATDDEWMSDCCPSPRKKVRVDVRTE